MACGRSEAWLEMVWSIIEETEEPRTNHILLALGATLGFAACAVSDGGVDELATDEPAVGASSIDPPGRRDHAAAR